MPPRWPFLSLRLFPLALPSWAERFSRLCARLVWPRLVMAVGLGLSLLLCCSLGYLWLGLCLLCLLKKHLIKRNFSLIGGSNNNNLNTKKIFQSRTGRKDKVDNSEKV
jgi:hypothetical protein